MKTSKTIIFTLSLALLFATGCNAKKSESPTTEPPITQPPDSQDSYLEFKSKSGYVMDYPSDWIIDDSQKDSPTEFIREPSGKAFVSMQTSEDLRLIKEGGRAIVFEDIKNALNNNSEYTIVGFELQESDPNVSPSYQATGTYKDKAGKNWMFREIGSLNNTGTIITLRATALEESAKTYGPIADDIIFSFRSASL